MFGGLNATNDQHDYSSERIDNPFQVPTHELLVL